MRRIIWILNTDTVGGAERFVIESIGFFPQDKGKLTIAAKPHLLSLIPDNASVEKRIFDIGPKLGRKTILDFIIKWKFYQKRIKGLLDCGFDLVMLQYKKEQFLTSLPAFSLGIPVIWVEHAPPPAAFVKNPFAMMLYRKAASRAKRVITFSERSKRRFIAFSLSEDKISLASVGVALRPIERKERFPTIAVVSRLSREKNIKAILDILPRITRSFPDTKLIIAGDGNRRDFLESYVNRLNLDRNVEFLGFVEDIQNVYAIATIVVLPSLQEGVPLSLVEAAGYGVPVVATDVGGVSEVVVDGKSGFLVPVRDKNALYEKIYLLLSTPSLRRRFSIEAKRIYQEKFLPERSFPYFWERVLE